MKFKADETWVILDAIEKDIKEKIESIGTPLTDWNVKINYGIKTGFNEAFIISSKKKSELLSRDPNSAEIIRPILRGRDIERYQYNFADLWLILAKYGSHKYIPNSYPAIYHHLSYYKSELKNRGQCRYSMSGGKITDRDYPGQHHWIELDNNPTDKYLDNFLKQKIVWKALGLEPAFTVINEEMFVNDKCNFLISGSVDLNYLCGFLNSKIFQWLFSFTGVQMGIGYEYKVQYLKLIPIPSPERLKSSEIFSKMVSERLDGKVSDGELNEWLFNSLNLTQKEKNLIEK